MVDLDDDDYYFVQCHRGVGGGDEKSGIIAARCRCRRGCAVNVVVEIHSEIVVLSLLHLLLLLLLDDDYWCW